MHIIFRIYILKGFSSWSFLYRSTVIRFHLFLRTIADLFVLSCTWLMQNTHDEHGLVMPFTQVTLINSRKIRMNDFSFTWAVDWGSIWLYLSFIYIIIVLYNIWLLYFTDNVLVHSRKKNGTNWWIVGIFSAPDGSISTEISISQKQFYFLLINDITEDLSNAFTSIKNIGITNIVFLLEEIDSFHLLSITTIVILLLSTCYLFSRRNCPGSKKNRGKSVKQQEERTKSGVENSKINGNNICSSIDDNVESGCHQNRKYYWTWLTGLLFVAFLLSLPWEFVRLYQSMVAEKVTHMTMVSVLLCVYLHVFACIENERGVVVFMKTVQFDHYLSQICIWIYSITPLNRAPSNPEPPPYRPFSPIPNFSLLFSL